MKIYASSAGSIISEREGGFEYCLKIGEKSYVVEYCFVCGNRELPEIYNLYTAKSYEPCSCKAVSKMVEEDESIFDYSETAGVYYLKISDEWKYELIEFCFECGKPNHILPPASWEHMVEPDEEEVKTLNDFKKQFKQLENTKQLADLVGEPSVVYSEKEYSGESYYKQMFFYRQRFKTFLFVVIQFKDGTIDGYGKHYNKSQPDDGYWESIEKLGARLIP